MTVPTTRPIRRRHSPQRGFTLIELLVALTAGLLVSIAAFSLARNASSFFQKEARLSAAQHAVMIGISRLTSDLQRASYLTVPNSDNIDYQMVGKTATNWPKGMQRLAGITILEGGSATEAQSNGLTPDALVLSGSFDSTELFGVRTIIASGTGAIIYLQTNDSAWARAKAAESRGAPALESIFKAGRMVRIADNYGWSTYGIVASYDEVTNPSAPFITLASTPAPAERSSSKHGGIHGLAASNYTINTVSRIRYDLRSVDDAAKYPQYANLFTRARHAASAYHRGALEPIRTELVRVELDAANAGDEYAEVDSTLDVVAEYAVDLKFGMTVESATPTLPATLAKYPIHNSTFSATTGYDIADDLNQTNSEPERLRAVQVRLTVRAAEADRDVTIPASSGGGLYRFALEDSSGAARGFARVRTVVTEVALPNNYAPDS
ncbi:MAG: type II secretion system protein [Deltaproteobacteria bacterium]|jgi:prepilin-type N-terminal cleavage/methylation domain-containing protein|nr:type II secretion system protein [Deltaproteobacteria bacterium]MBW2537223.1 type II secretion system protein [Deltaproteobacteria bacterium]